MSGKSQPCDCPRCQCGDAWPACGRYGTVEMDPEHPLTRAHWQMLAFAGVQFLRQVGHEAAFLCTSLPWVPLYGPYPRYVIECHVTRVHSDYCRVRVRIVGVDTDVRVEVVAGEAPVWLMPKALVPDMGPATLEGQTPPKPLVRSLAGVNVAAIEEDAGHHPLHDETDGWLEKVFEETPEDVDPFHNRWPLDFDDAQERRV